MVVNGFQYRRISKEEFDSAESQWNDLLMASDANPLFMSWEWIHGWWVTWAASLGIELHIYFIYLNERLVGILPLYSFNRRFWLFKEFHFIGNAWGRAPTVRSEYIGPIFTKPLRDELNKSFFAWIGKHGPLHSFIVADCINYDFAPQNVAIRKVDHGYWLDCSGDFEHYKSSLGAAVRLKVFNRVDYLLSKYSEIEFGIYDLKELNLDNFFNQLNEFHLVRWGKVCFDNNAVDFHKRLIRSMDKSIPVLSYIVINKQLVSLSYNIKSGDVLYNIQSGYIEAYDKKVALGALHFGYLIKYAFHNSDIRQLDFLAGRGKRSNYKASFRGSEVKFHTVEIFASALVGRIYKCWIKIRSKISSWRLKWKTP